ncbi:MAG: heat shock protein HspQ [Francisellaceae bacterium]|nr:heat shock protein HspQ [Francisellaceae bacterium]MBT6207186.1 heat shock protein HspQ [Francisellaceae bacterium]MBT6537861.1 heat shock protein HspQ [Francisellaceae bacterium]
MHIRFKIGQLVKSRRLGVRGVIIEYDYTYYRSESAYQLLANQSSIKNKPWYLLLMNDSNCTIYMPEDELLPDLSGREIDNPSINEHFEIFANGMYYKNKDDVKPLESVKDKFFIRRVK